VAFGALTDVVVGAAGVYSFESDGFADVRARLTDAAGRVVAANDDRPDDWNFRLSTRLEPGRYALRVTAVDGGVAYSEEGPLDSVTVSMRAPEEVAGPALRERAPGDVPPGPVGVAARGRQGRPPRGGGRDPRRPARTSAWRSR
jgi:hypothetical protein